MLQSKNNVVACLPFVVKNEDNGRALALVTKKIDIIPLTVVYPTANESSGSINVSMDDVVYVKAEDSNKAWAKDRYRLKGSQEEFILVPLNEIVFIGVGGRKVN